MSTTRGPRGPYAKSAAKRQQIVDAALAAYAEAGSRAVSVRDIAERVGLTDAGVLHHFGGREALLTAVLEARDAAAAERHGEGAAMWRPELIAENAQTPGLVKLFVDLAAAAAEPGHPAHDFFTERYQVLRHRYAEAIADAPSPDTASAAAQGAAPDAQWAARVLLAATDGLQLQWLLDPSIDMAADITRLRDALLATVQGAGAPTGDGPTA
ncbi:TetR/AcrR family transcriptional regulator [Kitasatospora viridis]|uniref:TetR family transcriptional regulator n=1 Tax=Kitasatospora viridis TaxID=281105 RepID=A0A561TVV8_9ACTN|nr:TetR/AcrR family transcriptional regulator [Kitasatospora viridis]TWF91247.1 TetR family transcriptional regulator [Kitasatospora viridis]